MTSRQELEQAITDMFDTVFEAGQDIVLLRQLENDEAAYERYRARVVSPLAAKVDAYVAGVIPPKITKDVQFDPPRNGILTIYKDGSAAGGYNLAIDDMRAGLEGEK